MTLVTCDASGCSNEFDPDNDEGCTVVEKDGDIATHGHYCCVTCLGTVQDE